MEVLRQIRTNAAAAFLVSVVAVFAATLVRYLFTPLIGPTGLPYIFYFPAVALVGLTGNLGAALFATLLSALAGHFFFIAPELGLAMSAPSSIGLVTFLATAGAIAGITARLEKALAETAARARFAAERTETVERQRADLERDSRRLALLADAANVGLPNPAFEDVARHAARRVAENIGDACIIRVVDGDRLNVVACHHVAPDAIPYVEAVLLQPEELAQNEFYARLLQTRRTVVVDNPRRPDLRRPVPPDLQHLADRYEPRHAVVTPIQLGDALVGALSIFRSQEVPYTDADLRATEAVAARVGLALENARLFHAAQHEAAEARKSRLEVEEASRVKDEFLATLSHELRTPLNAIIGWAHMLRDTSLPDDRRRAAVETIVRNAQSQEQLISDILEVQRIMAGKLRLDLRTIDLGDIVRAAAETVQPSADAKRIKLQLLLDLNVTTIAGDPDRLQQVTWNLLSNAIKFTPPNGLVQVKLRQTEHECEMSVEDNGPGISPAFLPYVFDRFRQADSSSTRRHQGLGLGLAIVRNLVEMHGGSIAAANVTEPDRTGAVFTIRLPRQGVARPAAAIGIDLNGANGEPHPAWVNGGPSLRETRVLVVDDQPDARELVGVILERYGADVILASSAEEAFIAFARRNPDVVVTDIEMPLEDGYALIRRIRALPPEAGGKVPAAALTAYASAGDRMKVLAAGFNMHVAKPVQPAELAMIVASLAGKALDTTETVETLPGH